jgi:non-ribosomal peptide synthetase component F
MFLRATLPYEYKHSYLHNLGTEPLCHLTLGQLLDIAAERRPDKEAFVSVYQDLRLTFGEVREQVSLSLINGTCIDGALRDRNGSTCWK